jgi:transglutaminase-like putative cysteine protease
MIVSATGGPVTHVNCSATVPIPWPEQSVKLIEQDLSPGVTVKYTTFGTGKQLVANFARIAADKDAHAFVIVEVTRHTLLPPDDTDSLVKADTKTLPAEFKPYLSASLPLIQSNHTRIRAVAKELAAGQTKAWPHVRAIYDWVRKTIQYKELKHKPDDELDTCVEAIDKGIGDCNQLTSTFIAICRASGIPARTVRIPDHCYPEFYLLDAEGNGHWYPAEASGTEDFGGIRTTKPILQKGDNFKITLPGQAAKTFRFLPENIIWIPRPGGKPAMKLVCEPAE